MGHRRREPPHDVPARPKATVSVAGVVVALAASCARPHTGHSFSVGFAMTHMLLATGHEHLSVSAGDGRRGGPNVAGTKPDRQHEFLRHRR